MERNVLCGGGTSALVEIGKKNLLRGWRGEIKAMSYQHLATVCGSSRRDMTVGMGTYRLHIDLI